MKACGKYVGTILNNRRWMRRIKKGRKTCEIKPRLTKLKKKCQYLVMRGNKKVQAGGCKYYLIARLLSRVPLGPFRSAKDVTEASKIGGQEFKTGMSEKRLDAFIQKSVSKEVFIYRFENARVSNGVVWDNRKGNNNPGFLSMFNKEKNCVRFTVRESGEEEVPRAQAQSGASVLPSRWTIPKQQKAAGAAKLRIPKIQSRVEARLSLEAARFVGPVHNCIDLSLDSD